MNKLLWYLYLLLSCYFFINVINCEIFLQNYIEPIPSKMVVSPGMNGCSNQAYSFLLVNNHSNIVDVQIFNLSSTPEYSLFNKPIVECSFTVSTPINSNTLFTIEAKEESGAISIFTIKPMCIDPTNTDYKIFSNTNESRIEYYINNQTKSGPSKLIWFESGINNENPPFFENLDQESSLYSSSVVFLKKSKKTGISCYRISFSFNSFNDYFRSITTNYTANNIIKKYQIDSSIKPIGTIELLVDEVYPKSKNSFNNIISFLNITYDKSNDPSIGIMTLTNGGRTFPVSSNGTRKSFLIYFNLNYGNSQFFSVAQIIRGVDSEISNVFFGGYVLNYQNITLNKEMSELFFYLNQTTNDRPKYYTFVFSSVPPTPFYPLVVEYSNIGWRKELYFDQYPFGLKNGHGLGYEIVFSAKVSNYFKGDISFYINSKPIRFFSVTQKIVDTTPPEILSSKYTSNIGGMKIVVEISILDQQSGFSTYVCLDDHSEIFNYKDISSGSIQNGTYKFVYDYGFTKNCSKSVFIDFAGNSLFVYQPFLEYLVGSNSNYFQMNQLPITSSFGLDEINLFKFKYYNVDLTNKGCYNTLYFNFKSDNNQDFVVKMKLTIANWWTSPTEYYSYWDNENQYYKIDFYLPPNLLPINIQYSLLFGLDGSDLEYSTQDIESAIGNNATLSVFSELGDMMPPFVSKLNYPKFTNITELNQDSNLIWEIEILDHLNGFDRGEITFVNSIDLLPISFNFDSSFSNSEPVANYTFKIPVPKQCSSSYYEIRHLKLFDKSGIYSEYNYAIPQTYPIIDPLVKFSDVLNHATIECPITTDWYAALPVLNNLEISTSSIDAGGLDSNRVVTFTIYVTANIFSIRNKTSPTIYLGDNYLNYIKVPIDANSLVLNNQPTNEYKYTTSFTIPYGYGYPGGIYLSIFGIQSDKSTFQGYSTFDLVNFSNKSSCFIDVPNFTIYSPKILSASPISNLGGQITIFGRYLLFEGSTIRIEYSNLTEQNITPIQYSGLAIKFNVRPTNELFTVSYYDKESNIIDSIKVTPFIDYWNVVTPTPTPTPTTTPTPLPTNPPKKCSGNPECGGSLKGNCVDGVGCVCITPYIGDSCTSRIVQLPPPILNSNQPSINLTTELAQSTNSQTFVSLISLVSLRELNFDKSVVAAYTFDKWLLESISETSSYFSTNITDPNDNTRIICKVSVLTQWYESITNIEFAGQSLVMNPSTLKYNINITSYPFASGLNTLQLVMSATAKTESTDDNACSSKEYGDTTSIDNSNYIQLSIEKNSLFARFIKRAIIDGLIISIENVQVTDIPLSTDLNSYYSSQAFIGINIPNFSKGLVQLDPDFGVLVNSEKPLNSICKGTNPNSSVLLKGTIIGVVVGVVGGAIIITVSILIFFKYKYHIKNWKISKLIKLNKL